MAAAALLVAATTLAAIPAASADAGVPTARPQILGGTTALGDPTVVALAVYDGRVWSGCSAALVRPRVLVTAAHCLTKANSDVAVERVRVFPPGARAVIYSDKGPRRPSPVRVQKWWIESGFSNRLRTVQANDVAVILLSSDLAPTVFTRVATQLDLSRWKARQAPVTHVGYGGVGTARFSRIPHAVDLPFATWSMRSSLGAVFTTKPSDTQALCAGDSGSPAFHSEAGQVSFIGTVAGATGACASSTVSSPSDIGFVAVGYLDLLNTGLAAAGYLTVPSAPGQIQLSARNRDVTVAWSASVQSPQTVVAYDVVDPSGTVVCQTVALTCSVPGLPDGSYSYAVMSRNAENQGDGAPPSTAAVVASPPAPAAPRVVPVSSRRYRIVLATLAGRTSAVVTSYVVRDQRGVVVCTVIPPNQQATQLDCAGPTKRGKYTVSVHAETEMGPSPESPMSPSFTIR